MNSDTVETATQIAREAGAIETCKICGSSDIYMYNEDSDKIAYGSATNSWKEGVRGFRGMDREEVMSLIKSVLDDASSSCPSCDIRSS